eukprot:CAMPEP_0113331146 /NCGR_PEP_ID=MMETSP0010_2-20120614/22289_1 /TAXON_ID=216773 ORGANISM="Corethron hystrix, Strain 308" /NCGR_SAMPLE_ID=MMETSP0010_2 /ASSEMBLY_ACC=CAM_ASM_000155 /LENGTH=500 /DNA_ID=CAMNT_0000194305 /DNA_START=162 /DNA_END=1664 /DNA_ORIENTATION=+ /assembly_acc=CAM_ASM_000155
MAYGSCNKIEKNNPLPHVVVDKKSGRARKKRPANWNMAAIRFASRLSIVLTTGSLFMLLRMPNGNFFPSGLWVFITCIFVSWYPSLDVASVMEKAKYRIIGTVIGGTLGVALGELSIKIPTENLQAIFLGCTITFVVFIFGYISISWKASDGGSYTYVHMIGILTFGIAMLPFCHDTERRLSRAVTRVVDVILGCILSCFGALLIWPRSTSCVVKERLAEQMTLSGETVEALLLKAAGTFSGMSNPLNITQLVRQGNKNKDSVHRKYILATDKIKSLKPLLRHLDSDPMIYFKNCYPKETFIKRSEATIVLARAFRLQTSVIMVDSIVRNKKLSFTPEQIELIASIGYSLKSLLVSDLEDDCEGIEQDIFEKFKEVNGHKKIALELISTVSKFMKDTGHETALHSLEKDEWLESVSGDRIPFFNNESDAYGQILFFEMIEHIILRSLRTYFAWRYIKNTGKLPDQDIKQEDRRQSEIGMSRSESSFATLRNFDSFINDTD